MLTAAQPLKAPLPRVCRLTIEFGLVDVVRRMIVFGVVSAAGLTIVFGVVSAARLTIVFGFVFAARLTIDLDYTFAARWLIDFGFVLPVWRTRQTVAGNLGEHRRNARMARCVIAQRLARLLQPLLERETRGDRSGDGDAPPLRLLLERVTRGAK